MDSAALTVLAELRDDPLEFARAMFPSLVLRPWQEEALRRAATKPRLAIRAGRKVGKTTVAAIIALWFLFFHPGSLVFVLAPTWKQLDSFRETLLYRFHSSARLRALTPEWTFTNDGIQTGTPGWRAIFASAESGPAFLESAHAGGGPTLVIYDEAKSISREAKASCEGMLGGPDDREAAISTPSIPAGWFYECFTSDRERWSTMKISASDVPELRDHYEEQAKRYGRSSSHFLQQSEGEFAGAEDGDCPITFDIVDPCIGRGFRPDGTIWPKIAALDQAGAGTNSDESVVTLRHGPVIVEQIAWRGREETETIGRFLRLAGEFEARTLIMDALGGGGTTLSIIRERMRGQFYAPRVLGFKASWAAFDSANFYNLKTELVFALAERFRARRIGIPDDEVLIGQLTAWKAETRSDGRLKIVDPQGKSPDRSDSALMAFAVEHVGRSEVTTGFISL